MQNIVYLRPRRLYKVGEHTAVAGFEEACAVTEAREYRVPNHRMAGWHVFELQDQPAWLLPLPCSGYGPHLFTHCAVNANSGEEAWYGFESWEELQFFRKLMTLDKVGPKSAFKVLAGTPYAEIHKLLVAGDREGFAKLPGMGPKMAAAALPLVFAATPETKPKVKLNEDAVSALCALGMLKAKASELVSTAMAATPGASTEELVKVCLKRK
jgi:holliday junction DNA helicase RuvA